MIAIVSLWLWYLSGSVCSHSIEDGMWLLQIMARCLDSASQAIKININRAVNEIIAPTDDITFHVVYVSG